MSKKRVLTAEQREENRIRSNAWAAAHRELARERARQWYRDNKKRALRNIKKYARKNCERVRMWKRAARRRYLLRHPLTKKQIMEKRAYTKQWRLKHRMRAKINARNGAARRRLRKMAVIEPIDYAKVMSSTDGRCGICGGVISNKAHYDHIIPLSKGGSHTTGNLQLAHPTCNMQKASKIGFTLKQAA